MQGRYCDIGAFELTYPTISGNTGIGDATLQYEYGGFVVADHSGDYSIQVPPGWSGTVVPPKPGYSFTPDQKIYTNVQGDQTDQSYVATADSYIYAGHHGDTWRVSIASDGTQSDEESSSPSISANGRYVAFLSSAPNFTPADTDYGLDVFVHDNQTGQTDAVLVYSDGMKLACNSYNPSISADGRYVAFETCSGNGTSLDVVYVYDHHTGMVTDLTPGTSPVLSADGRFIAFMYRINFSHPWVIDAKDWFTDVDTSISVSSNGTSANADATSPSISADGRHVAFSSSATNLVDGDTNGAEDVFVHDIQTGETTRVSVDSNGIQANSASFKPSISADGRYIAFSSCATNLVSGDTNEAEDVFVHDIQTGKTMRVSINSDGLAGNGVSDLPHISGVGRYIAFRSSATNLVTGDTNNMADIFVYDRQANTTKRVSVSSDGVQSNGDSSSSYYNGLAISADGSFIAFSSDASNLVNGDTNEYGDVFVHDATVKLTPIPPSTPTPRPNMPLQESAALAPASLNTQNGSTSGSLSSLGLLQQAGTEDTPSAYVTFQTPGSVYTMD